MSGIKTKSKKYLSQKSAYIIDSSDAALTPELAKKAEEELGETPAKKTECIGKLKEKLKAVPDLNPRLDDAFLLRFLRVRKFDVDKAFQHVISYYRIKADYPDIFKDFVPSAFKQFLTENRAAFLPHRNDDGALVAITGIGKYDPTVYTMDDWVRSMFAIFEWAILSVENQIEGVRLIIDCDGFNLQQMMHMKPRHFSIGVKFFQSTVPVRFKSVHYVNENRLMNIIFGLFKPLLSKKMQDRLHMCGTNYDKIFEVINADIVPTDFGGNSRALSVDDFMAAFLKTEDEFKHNNQFGFKTTGVNKEEQDADMLRIQEELKKVIA